MFIEILKRYLQTTKQNLKEKTKRNSEKIDNEIKSSLSNYHTTTSKNKAKEQMHPKIRKKWINLLKQN